VCCNAARKISGRSILRIVTANFGTGCISPWQQVENITIQSSLSFDTNYPFAEFNDGSGDAPIDGRKPAKLCRGTIATSRIAGHGCIGQGMIALLFSIGRYCP
jgi:hypothetical protein